MLLRFDDMSSSSSFWQFIHAARPAEVEFAYREHYLDSDVYQLKISVYAISALLVALTALDLIRLSQEPGLLPGIVVKAFFLILGIGIVLMCNKLRNIRVLDLCVMIYTACYAIALLATHIMNDYSATRIVAIVLIFVFTAHIALPVYSAYLFPAMAILLSGESYILFTYSTADLGLDRNAIVALYFFALLISVAVSASQQRARFLIFQAQDEVKTLSGFLPICASCKAIRNDEGYYQRIEQYISDHSDAIFTHGICPTCAKELLGDFTTMEREHQ